MFKGSATSISVYVFDPVGGLPVTGDAANLTAYVNKDYAGVNALADTSATEMSSANAPGFYSFAVSGTETNADTLLFTATSSTPTVSVMCVPPVVFTTAQLSSDGYILADMRAIAGSATAVDTGGSGIVSFNSNATVATLGATMPADVVQIDGENVASDGAGKQIVNVAAVYDPVTDNYVDSVVANMQTVLSESYAADGAAGTAAQILYLVQQVLTEFAITSTSNVIKGLDGSTGVATLTLNSDTAPTSLTRSS